MLTRLVSAQQVVLLCDTHHVYLFYCGNVYRRPASSGFVDLPVIARGGYHPIWALIHVDYEQGEVLITGGSDVWPIQASSPNPARWQPWLKRNNGAMLGMPVWSMHELKEGYAHVAR